MNRKENTVVCILGMHRSGTSMITRLLNICGLSLGDEKNIMTKSYSENIKGHWENIEILHINEKILETFGGTWDMPPRLLDKWEDDKRLNQLYERAREVVKKMNGAHEIWGFKEPRTSLTLPFWQKVIPHMKYVIPVRHPANVAASLHKRDGINLDDGIMLWLTYIRSILKYTKGKDRIFTFFDNYFVDAHKELRRVCDFLNIDYTDSAKQREIANFISDKLRHNKVVFLTGSDDFSYEDVVNLASDAFLNKGTKRDEKFYILLEQINKLSKQIAEQEKVNAQLSKQIAEQEKVNAQLSKQIAEQEKVNAQKDFEIRYMKSSKFWQLRNVYVRYKKNITRVIKKPNIFVRHCKEKTKNFCLMKYVPLTNIKNGILFFHALLSINQQRLHFNERKAKLIFLQVHSFDKGGLEEVVFALARSLKETYNVCVIASFGKNGYMEKVAKKSGINVINLHGNRFLLKKVLNKYRPDIIHFHYSDFGFDIYRKLGIKSVYTIHNNYIWADKEFIKSRKRFYAGIDRFVAVSSQVKEYFTEKFHIEKDNISVILNGINVDLVKNFEKGCRDVYGFSEDDFIFINIASFNWHKFHISMVVAMDRLIEKYPKFKMIFMGNILDKSCYDYIASEIKKRHLDKNIRIMKYMPKKKVMSILQMSDCFIMPSLIEGCSIAVLEAMYAQLPMILSDIGSARDVINDSDIGIIVDNPYNDVSDISPKDVHNFYTNDKNIKNIDSIKNAMVAMYRNHTTWRKKALQGRKKIKEKYTVENMSKQYDKLYKELL